MVAEARARFTWDSSNFKAALDGTVQNIDRVNQNQLKKFAKQMAAAFSVGMVINWARRFVSESLRVADEIDNLSKKLDIGVESTQSLRRVAETSGIEFGQLEGAISRTRVEIERANTGNAASIERFKALGISIDDLRSKNTEQIFEQVARAMSKNKGDAETLNAAYELMGARSGPQLQRMLENLGEEGFAALNARMLETNQILSEGTINSLDRVEEAIERFSTRAKTWATELLGETVIGWERVFQLKQAGWDEELRQQNLIDDAIAKTYERLAGRQERRQARERELHEEQMAALAELERLRAGSQEKLLTHEQEREQILERINALETESVRYSMNAEQHAVRLLEIERDVISEREKLAGVNAKIQKDEEAALRERERLESDIARAKERFNEEERRYILDQLDGIDKLRQQQSFIQRDREAAREKLNALDRDSIQNQAEIIRLETVILNLTRQEEQLQREINKQIEAQGEGVENIVEKWKDLDSTDIRVLVDLRDALKDMNEEEIDAFIESVEHLAKGLEGLGEAVDVSWLQSLVNLGELLKGGVSGMAARDYARAIGDLARILARDVVEPPNLEWLSKLVNLRDLFRGGASGMAARDYARAIGDLARMLGRVDAPNTDWLKDLTDFILPDLDAGRAEAVAGAIQGIADAVGSLDGGALSDLAKLFDNWPSNDVTLDLRLPSDADLTLKVPDTLNDNLPSIARSLETLANLKGVVWA